MGGYMDSLETVIILIDLSFKFCYLLFSLSPNILYFISKIFKIVIKLFILVIVARRVTLSH